MTSFRWIVIALLLLLSGCEKSIQTLKTGILLDEAVSYNEDQIAGARMLVQEVNQSGGVRIGDTSYRVQLLIRDCGAYGSKAGEVMRELIARENISIFIGPNSTHALVRVKPLLANHDIVMFTNGSTLPDILTGTDNLFRMTYNDKDAVGLVFRFLRQKLNSQRPVALYDKVNPFTSGFVKSLKQQLIEKASLPLHSLGYLTGEKDFRNLVAALTRLNPDAIILPGFTQDLKQQLQLIRAMGIEAPVIALDSLEIDKVASNPDFYNLYAVQLIHGSSLLDNKQGQLLYERYLRRFQRPPSVGSLINIDTLNLIFEIMRQEQTTSARHIAKILNEGFVFDGYIGRAIFDQGESQLRPRLYRIDNNGISEEVW